MLNGPREAGKKTLMRQLIQVTGGELRNLDDETLLAAALRDPVGAASKGSPGRHRAAVSPAGDHPAGPDQSAMPLSAMWTTPAGT